MKMLFVVTVAEATSQIADTIAYAALEAITSLNEDPALAANRVVPERIIVCSEEAFLLAERVILRGSVS